MEGLQGADHEEESAQQHTDLANRQTYPLTDAVKARLDQLDSEKQRVSEKVLPHPSAMPACIRPFNSN